MNNSGLVLLVAIFIMVFGTNFIMAQELNSERGSEILMPFKSGLQTALLGGLSRGVVEAIGVCQIQAPEIAEAQSIGDIRLGRSSHRLRNPDNAAPEWVEPIMQSYLDESSDGEARVVSLGDDRLGYVEPIQLQPVCTACHGEALEAHVAQRLEELYPQDKAVGFKVGDFRGVFWLEYPIEE